MRFTNCGMLVISAHAVTLEIVEPDRSILDSREFEFFWHFRNASATATDLSSIRAIQNGQPGGELSHSMPKCTPIHGSLVPSLLLRIRSHS